jgi:hypothetical protein
MLTGLNAERCEIWLHCDGTLHQVRPELLLLDGSALGIPLDARGRRQFPAWAGWTVARHLAHRQPAVPAPAQPVQEALFADTGAAHPS